MAENAVFIDGRQKQYAYCAVCDGKGPVTYYKCGSCGRTNDLHKPRGVNDNVSNIPDKEL